MDEADKQQVSTLLQSSRSNSEIAYWLSRNYPHEIETLNLETGDIADYRTTAQGMELEVLDAEEKRLAVLYFRWDEVAPLLRGVCPSAGWLSTGTPQLGCRIPDFPFRDRGRISGR